MLDLSAAVRCPPSLPSQVAERWAVGAARYISKGSCSEHGPYENRLCKLTVK